MKYLELSDEEYARLEAAAEAEGVSPVQMIANLLIREGHLPPGYRVEDDPEYRQATGLESSPA
jgi:hypothetical protein